MKKTLLLLTSLLSLWFSPPQAFAAQTTLKDQMTWVHERFDVNFIYDSGIDLKVVYKGTPLQKLVASVASESDERKLRVCLDALFEGTGISWELNRKYVVLTKGKKKPKQYVVFIEEKHDTISESRITAHVDRQRNATQTGMKKIDGRRFRGSTAPLAQPDLIKALQQLPGVAAGTEMLSGMYVRGGTGSDNMFLLDGVPLYQQSHLAGLFSSFNTDVVDHLDFYKSGFPSRYGGMLSSVADITTSEGNMKEYHGMFSVGLINGSIQFEGPIVEDKTSFNIAMRRSWLDVLTLPALAILNHTTFSPKRDVNGRYAMTDLNASVTHLFSKDNQLSLNLYTGRDVLNVLYQDNMVEYWEGERFTGSNGLGIDLSWGNVLASLNWKYKIGEGLNANVIAYYSRTANKVGYNVSSWEFDRKIILETLVSELNKSNMDDIGVKADFDWQPLPAHHVRYGGGVGFLFFNPRKDISHERTYTGSSPALTHDFYKESLHAGNLGLYVEDEMSFGSWFKTNVGLRYSMFNSQGETFNAIEPRLALRFQCGGMAALKLSYSEMNQYVHYVRSMNVDLPMTLWMPSSAEVSPMLSRQLAAGVYLDLPHRISLNVEGFCKTMDNILEYMGSSVFYPSIQEWESDFVSGKGLVYGAELEFSWSTDKTDISAGYTLSWNRRLFKEFYPLWYPDRYDNRHKLTVSATHKFSDRFDVYAGWNYRSGNRLTLQSHGLKPAEEYPSRDYEFFSSPYNYTLPAYHRLDLGMNFRKTTKRGNESVWTVSIYNAYNRMNYLFADVSPVYKDGESTGEYKGTGYAVVPVLPTFSYTLRF